MYDIKIYQILKTYYNKNFNIKLSRQHVLHKLAIRSRFNLISIILYQLYSTWQFFSRKNISQLMLLTKGYIGVYSLLKVKMTN